MCVETRKNPFRRQWVSGFAGVRPNLVGCGPRKSNGESMVRFTDKAREMVLAFMSEGDEGREALRISMEGSPLAPRFELTLVGMEERRPDEHEVDAGDRKSVV